MFTKVNLIILSIVFGQICLGQNSQRSQTKEISIPMQARYWDFQDNQVEFAQKDGVAVLRSLTSGQHVVLKDHIFKDGTIQFDVSTSEPGFASIYFRRDNADEAEIFYLRMQRAGDPMAGDAIQYAPLIKGINLWDMLWHYQAPAEMKMDVWNHVKLVIRGKQMKAYVNDMEQPALNIPFMEGNTESGSISFMGKAEFANLKITPFEGESLSPATNFDLSAHDIRYLKKWEISKPFELPFGQDLQNENMPNDSTQWEAIEAERLGLINITRKYGGSKDRSKRQITWLKTTIESDYNQVRKLDLGFSDEVWVILDKQLVYLDKNYYNSPIMKQPKGRISLENTTVELNLKEGKNELLIGVGNFFFGWGLMARFDQLDGISL